MTGYSARNGRPLGQTVALLAPLFALLEYLKLAYTSFFRDVEVLDAIGSIVVPWASAQREMKIWDAGCATGEEAYSLAMVFAERLDPFTIRNVRIMATDREESGFPQFETRVTQGRYHRQDLQWIPAELRAIYFQPTEDEEVFEAVATLKDCIRYLRHDLVSLEPVDSGFALVVCKNVLMHISPPLQPQVIAMFHQALRPGGYLAFDTFQELPAENRDQFELVEDGLKLFRKRPES